MKLSQDSVRCKSTSIPNLRFEDQSLTSYAGLVLFQVFLQRINLKQRLEQLFGHLPGERTYGAGLLVYILVIHLLIGCRRIREISRYCSDPMVLRVCGLDRLPDVSTISRTFKKMDRKGAEQLRNLIVFHVLSDLKRLGLRTVTLDFDGSVIGTARFAEGTAVGFNRKKKGQRSYYPLFCTVAQTGQIFNLLHRPGNVHDSNGAQKFIQECISLVRQALPKVRIEVRMDSAFFSDEIVRMLDKARVEFSISVPFERFPVLRGMIESRERWRRGHSEVSFFEKTWKPDSWGRRYRFVFIRTIRAIQRKGVIQLDFFIPQDFEFEYKVVVTNKRLGMRNLMLYHNGRGSQENVFAELKSQGQMDYVPFRSLYANQVFLMSSILAFNLNRHLQIETQPILRQTTRKRAALWAFEKLDTVRQRLIQRAGRIIRPQGRLTLVMSGDPHMEREFHEQLAALGYAA